MFTRLEQFFSDINSKPGLRADCSENLLATMQAYGLSESECAVVLSSLSAEGRDDADAIIRGYQTQAIIRGYSSQAIIRSYKGLGDKPNAIIKTYR